MQRVLVAGATGYLGRHIAAELKRRGCHVRAIVRRPEQRDQLTLVADDVRVAQVTDAESVLGLAEDVDAVVTTVGITRQRDGFSYEQVDFAANRNLLQEAQRARVRRFQYVSVYGGPALRRTRLADAKERFVDLLQAAPVSSCVVRPTGFFVDLGAYVAMARAGVALVIGDGTARMNPISGPDLASVCVDALAGSTGTVEAGGPDVYTYDDIARLAFATVGRRPRVLHLPAPVARMAVSALRTVTPVTIYGAAEFFVAAVTREAVAPSYGRERLAQYFAAVVRRQRGH